MKLTQERNSAASRARAGACTPPCCLGPASRHCRRPRRPAPAAAAGPSAGKARAPACPAKLGQPYRSPDMEIISFKCFCLEAHILTQCVPGRQRPVPCRRSRAAPPEPGHLQLRQARAQGAQLARLPRQRLPHRGQLLAALAHRPGACAANPSVTASCFYGGRVNHSAAGAT